MVKRFSILLVTIVLGISSFAQDNIPAKNSVYFELLGKGMFYSFNYERELFRANDQLSFNGSIGFCIMNGFTSIEKSKDFLMPFEINAKYSFDKHHVVLGYGTTYYKYKINHIEISNSNLNQQPVAPELITIKEWFAHLTMEYRYQKPDGKLMLKAGFTPLFFAATSHSAFDKKINGQGSINLGAGFVF